MKDVRGSAIASLLALAACAHGPAVEERPVGAPVPEASFVAPPVGQQSTWLVDDGSRITWTVVSVSDGQYEIHNDQGEQLVLSMPFSAALSWSGPKETGHATPSTDPRALFPLRVGKQLAWSRQGVNNGEPFSSHTSCSVVDETRVAVPASEFDTFKVFCTSGGNPNRPYRTSTYYFAPEINSTVRYFNQTTDNRDESDNQLIAIIEPATS